MRIILGMEIHWHCAKCEKQMHLVLPQLWSQDLTTSQDEIRDAVRQAHAAASPDCKNPVRWYREFSECESPEAAFSEGYSYGVHLDAPQECPIEASGDPLSAAWREGFFAGVKYRKLSL